MLFLVVVLTNIRTGASGRSISHLKNIAMKGMSLITLTHLIAQRSIANAI